MSDFFERSSFIHLFDLDYIHNINTNFSQWQKNW